MTNTHNCKGCTHRFVGCHSFCEDYKRFREELDKHNENIRNMKKGINDNHNRVIQCIEKNRRSHR